MPKEDHTRIRRPSSDRETETLLKLIVRYGKSWKDLKDRNMLESRDQTSLRDKARNMEMDDLIQV